LEFIINKIDTDVRKKIQDETKEDKVHSSKSINVKRDLNDREDKDISEKQNPLKNEVEKRYITVNGIKDDNRKIDIKAQKLEEINVENSKGRILDTKK
jgi:hypothetical protein